MSSSGPWLKRRGSKWRGASQRAKRTFPIKRERGYHPAIETLEQRLLLTAQSGATAFELLPIVFESYTDSAANIAYVSHGADINLLLRRDGAVMDFGRSISAPTNPMVISGQPETASPPQVSMTWLGGNTSPSVSGLDEFSGVANSAFFDASSKSESNLSSFNRVKYDEVYDGIDLEFYAHGENIEFDWIVAPLVDPSQITMIYSGMDNLSLDAGGNLVFLNGNQQLVQHAPIVYQVIDGQQHEVAASYRLGDGGAVRFALGRYDPNVALVIDPVLTTSTYLGGSRNETVQDVASDADGNTYVVGTTRSSDLAPDSGGDDGRRRGFVTKLDAEGQIVYTALLGPVDTDSPYLQSDGDAVTVGPDGSPIVSYELTAYSEPDAIGVRSITGATRHLVKLSDEGELIFDTTVASWSLGFGSASMAVDQDGSAYLSVQGLDEVPFGTQESYYITKVDAEGTLVFAQPFFTVGAIAVDADHNIYLGTYTSRDDFSVTTGAIQPQKADTNPFFGDLYIAELDPTASGLIAATYLGGSGDEFLGDLAVKPDRPGIVYLTGNTTSADFPVEEAFQPTLNPGSRLGATGGDGFITVLDLTKMELVASTFFGGGGTDVLTDIALDTAGNVYVTGTTDSLDFPVANPLLPTLADGPAIAGLGYPRDFVVTRFDSNLQAPAFSTYFGGTGDESERAPVCGLERNPACGRRLQRRIQASPLRK